MTPCSPEMSALQKSYLNIQLKLSSECNDPQDLNLV